MSINTQATKRVTYDIAHLVYTYLRQSKLVKSQRNTSYLRM